MHKVTVVVLSKYADIWRAFHESLDKFVPKDIRRIVVADGNEIKPIQGWEIIRGPAKFTMAGNYNIGFRAVDSDGDILCFNDDCFFLEPDPLQKLHDLAYSEPRIGCVSAHVRQGWFANPLQCNPRQDVPITFLKTSGNGMASYMRRDMLNEVGLFDETFDEAYGAEDADFTYRINLAGWKVGVARDVPVKHGFGNLKSTATSLRAFNRDDLFKSNAQGVQKFVTKHGHFNVQGEWDWKEETKVHPETGSIEPRNRVYNSFDLFNTLTTSRHGYKAGEAPVSEHIPIAENIAKVMPHDVIVSDYYDPKKAEEILHDVCGLWNRMVVTENGKETGKVWKDVHPQSHTGDNPQTDVASALQAGIKAEQTDLWKLTPIEESCGELGWAMREARLSTFNTDPSLRALEVFQIEKNFPLMMKIAYALDKEMRTGKYKRLLLCSRDCFLLSQLMQRLFVGAYPIQYFYNSRVTRYRPSKVYLDYAKPLVKDALVVDLTGTGNSLRYFCDQHGGTPMIAILFPSSKANVQWLVKGGLHEAANLARHGMVMGVTASMVGRTIKFSPDEYNPMKIDWQNEPRIVAMHNAFLNCIREPLAEPTTSLKELLEWHRDPVLTGLMDIHMADSKAAYELLKSGALPHEVIL